MTSQEIYESYKGRYDSYEWRTSGKVSYNVMKKYEAKQLEEKKVNIKKPRTKKRK